MEHVRLNLLTADPGLLDKLTTHPRTAVAAAGCPADAVFHDLRHYNSSLLIGAGENVKTALSRLGHASPVEMLIPDSHLWPDSENTTRTAVEAAFSKAASGRRHDDLRTETSA